MKEIKQKAKDFIDRIGKESGGNWLDKYYLTDLLVMFATEETKELKKEYSDNLSLKDEELMCLETEFNTYKGDAKETIQALYYCLKNYDKTVLCGELITAISKAEIFLNR
jgi:hypothetical protein